MNLPWVASSCRATAADLCIVLLCCVFSDGECLGTISNDSSEQQQQFMQQQYGGYTAMAGMQQPPADINPRTGLDAARLAAQFERPSAELVSSLPARCTSSRR
jgi:hypothetical protein